jgi:hypothetical protein
MIYRSRGLSVTIAMGVGSFLLFVVENQLLFLALRISELELELPWLVAGPRRILCGTLLFAG